MAIIYHLATVPDWQLATDTGSTYYPPTYAQDGFTHATKDPQRLLTVANHFYQASQDEWLCLAMDEQAIAAGGVTVKYEPAANVGDQSGQLDQDSEQFPHIYGGISPDMVQDAYTVKRSPEGVFLEIALPANR